MNCDKEKGICQIGDSLPDQPQILPPESASSRVSFYYFGDPMCSWCWGGSETFSELERQCNSLNFNFNIITGGLRAGGGDEWNASFRQFLKDEWDHVAQRTGQPFTHKLLERAHFEYDTEPACRAVNTARHFLKSDELYNFFKAIQYQFYVLGDDPKEISFYQSLCEKYSIQLGEFEKVFKDSETKSETIKQFTLCRQWGIRSFPTVCFEYNGQLHPFIGGYIPPEYVGKLIKEKVIPLIRN
ncbi:DsbA family protein [Morganella morganii]|uniref:DsbA family protein n=1 Tax=Morganella morganii TaxID=582 RepID=UPI00189BDE49|nr:hypothetical protein [Morganella morganii]